MRGSPSDLNDAGLRFLRERRVATLTSLLPDGSLHVVPVGFTWDADSGLARVITSGPSRKARNLAAGGDAALSQFDGAQWLTLSGTGVVSDDPERVADAVRRYAERYREPRVNPLRVVIEITVTSILGSRGLFAD
ncbi:TIGR03618 family F420-dependent PPOX class oxidoreductase [Jatrophihabitans sp.]|uniref:pyridoxamine 5'-phosphate oxidase family protein n=1 Tax=Jatrophihabitans sp. TaxID=1932789 RepID=UPI0030C743BB